MAMLVWKILFPFNKGSFCFIHIEKKNMNSNRYNRESWPAYLRSQFKKKCFQNKGPNNPAGNSYTYEVMTYSIDFSYFPNYCCCYCFFILVVWDTIEDRLDLGFVVIGFLLSAVENESAGETNNIVLCLKCASKHCEDLKLNKEYAYHIWVLNSWMLLILLSYWWTYFPLCRTNFNNT